MTVELRLLGPPIVLMDGTALPAELEWRKHKALLIYLTCAGERGKSRDHLGELLWPSGNSVQSLRQGLVVIRKVLGAEAVEDEGDLVRIAAGSVRTDLEEVRRRSAAGDWSGAAGLIRGEFCEGLVIKNARDFDEWLTRQRLQWKETGVGILVQQAQRLLDAGESGGSRIQFDRAYDLDPYSEPAIRGLMRALALDGQHNAAMEEYRLFLERLEEIGRKPSAETRSFADRLRHLRPRAPTRDTAETRRPPLTGRGRELGTLTELWEKVKRDSHPGVAVIMGDAGSGKSRLVEEIGTRVRLDGGSVSAVRLVAGDQHAADGALIGLARGGLLDAGGLAAAPPPALYTLSRRIPEWAERYPPQAPSAMSLPEALGQVLRTVAEERPLLLVVDDAQWGDTTSLDGLVAILRDHPRIPLLLLIASETEPSRAEIERIRSRVGRDLPGATIGLGPLSLADVIELAGWALPTFNREQLDRVARRVLPESAGLPFLVIELLSAVALGLDLGRVNGAWPEPFRTLTDTLPGGLPDSVVAALRVGFRRLSPAAQQVLRILAVVGRRASGNALAAVAELSGPEVESALDELEWQRWVNADSRGYTFVAGIAQQVIATDMTTAGQRDRIKARWDSLTRSEGPRSDLPGRPGGPELPPPPAPPG